MPILAYRMFLAFGLLAALSVAILVAGKLYGHSLVKAGHTSSTQRFEIIIGNDALSVPANMIRKQDQRRPGLANQVDLYIHWPSLSGFRDNLASAFNDVDPGTNSIVFISITARSTTKDMAGRFDPVYRNVMTGAATDLGHGLKSHALSQEHGYINERLIYSLPDLKSGRRFVVRCQDTEAAQQVILAPCETDIQIGETLSAQIRFPASLLDDWRKLNAVLPELLDKLLVKTED
ncbi:MAG: hypothetical protein WAU86_14515 [Oricola sp.]